MVQLLRAKCSTAAAGVAILACLVSADYPALTPSKSCCQALATGPGLQGKVLFPNSAAYTARVDSIWSFDAALAPWCVVMPESTADTSAVMKIIHGNQCPFGIRSGGHAVFAGSNSVEDGVTIDFGYMNGTSYDAATNTASLQPGGRWGDVYSALGEHSVGVAGGGQTTVGVAGFLLGGGMSFFNNAYGFGCDTVKNVQLVLANGSVIDANAHQNRDLWVSLKGGSGNFGLVTRFDLEAIPLASNTTHKALLWAGTMSWNISQIYRVLDTMVNFTDHVGQDEASSSHILTGYVSGVGYALLGALENKDNVDPVAFDAYKAIPERLSSTLRSDTLYNAALEFSGSPRSYNIWIPGAVRNDAALQRWIYDRHDVLIDKLIEILPANASWSSVLQLQPISLPMIAAGKGTNSIGLDNMTAPGIMTSISFTTDSADVEQVAHPLVLACQRDIDNHAAALDAMWSWRYLNYADLTYDPIASYGTVSVERMRQVSTKYDPDGVFQKLRKSGFKIPS
ncbi:hypothetical protein F5Y14DRAFT_419393 [Nemania sp. NC0429]|nr:hypothetical protein F5Y14DRAFT_419393 [Nemania sp. NC0429]